MHCQWCCRVLKVLLSGMVSTTSTFVVRVSHMYCIGKYGSARPCVRKYGTNYVEYV